MKKRLLSLLLVLVMALQPCLAVTAWADDDEVLIEGEEAAEIPVNAVVQDETAEVSAIASAETELMETSDEAQLYKGWARVRGEWYYYDDNGLPLTGWLEQPKSSDPKEKETVWYYCNKGLRYSGGVYEIGGKQYLFNADGTRASGWANIPYLDPDTGVMQDLWYYCNKDGTSYSGWKKDSTDYYYYDNSVPYHDGLFEIGGQKYGFDKQGRMIVGWYSENWVLADGSTVPHWYYFGKNGVAANGWVKDKTNWYYMVDGSSYFGGVYMIGGENYAFDLQGCMVTGVYTETVTVGKESWVASYLFDSDGKGITGWKKEADGWHYYDKGVPANNTIKNIDGNSYGFDRNGKMAVGWLALLVEEDGKAVTVWAHFEKNGKGSNGWLKNESKKWFYFVNGAPYRNGVFSIGGVNYGFKSSGEMATGWYSRQITEGGEKLTIWYYFNSNGKGFSGWKKDSKNWYYMTNGVSKRKGVFLINGDRYGFDKVGKMLAKSWMTYDGNKYYFGSDGKAYKNGSYKIGGVSYTFDANGCLV